MDEQAARTVIQRLKEILDSTASKCKKHRDKVDEYRITFKHLKQCRFVMWPSDWELDWDKVQGLYDLHISIPSFIIDDAVLDQWSPAGTEQWTGLDDPDMLYAHVVLLSLTPLNLLNLPEGREQGNYGGSPSSLCTQL